MRVRTNPNVQHAAAILTPKKKLTSFQNCPLEEESGDEIEREYTL